MNIGLRSPQGEPAKLESACDSVILCADEETRDAIAHWFTALPACATIAEDGFHANRLLQNAANRLLITDRLLPPWPGLDTLRTLRERNPNLRIAFVESGSLDDRILARITGFTDFLPRPLRREALVRVVTRTEPSA